MKVFTTIFCTLLIGIAIGYAWASQAYLQRIRILNNCLDTYQEYFINYAKDEPWQLPHIQSNPKLMKK